MSIITIAFISQKGGVGKSGLARSVAVELSKEYRIKFADMDVMQTTSVTWHHRRLQNNFDPVGSFDCFRSVSDAQNHCDGYDVLVIDGAGRSSVLTKEIATHAHIVIQPTNEGLDDLDPAVLMFHELKKAGIPPSRLFFVLSKVMSLSQTERARAYLSQTPYGVLDGYLRNKAGYLEALDLGKALNETRYKALNEEATLIIDQIFAKLNEITDNIET